MAGQPFQEPGLAQQLLGHSPWFESPFWFTALEAAWFSDRPSELGTWGFAGLVAPAKFSAVCSPAHLGVQKCSCCLRCWESWFRSSRSLQGAFVLWRVLETSQEVAEPFSVGVVGCWAIPGVSGIGFAQRCLVFWWISGEHCEHQTHPVIWDWLNLSLLEAAVFITVIVLLCCYFALEEY